MENESLPLVSIGIPTFNRVSSLIKAIESVLQQTYTNIELIISDNASIDETQSVCQKFKEADSRITYIRQSSNFGAANNFSQVLKLASGDYFMWLGDDDWLDKCYIYECVNVLINNHEYTLVSGRANYFINSDFIYQGNIINLEQDNGRDRVISYYKQVSDNGVFYGVMRREQISKIPMQQTMGSDWLMIASLAFLGRIKTINDTAVNRQFRENETFKELAVRLGMPKFQKDHPILSICISASNDIFISNSYQILSFIKKLNLSFQIILLFWFKYSLSTFKHKFIVFIALHTPQLIYPQIRSIYRLLK